MKGRDCLELLKTAGLGDWRMVVVMEIMNFKEKLVRKGLP